MKKSFSMKILYLCMSFLILAGCTNKGKKQLSAEIEFWSFPNFTSETGEGGGFEKSLIEAFQKEYPGIKVNFTLISFADGEAKIEAAIAEGKAPDVIYDAPGRILAWAD